MVVTDIEMQQCAFQGPSNQFNGQKGRYQQPGPQICCTLFLAAILLASHAGTNKHRHLLDGTAWEAHLWCSLEKT